MSLYWALSFCIGGREFRFAQTNLEIEGLDYEQGLGDLRLSKGNVPDSVAVSVVSSNNWAGIMWSQRLQADGGDAVLYLATVEDGVTTAEEWVRGTVDELEWGALNEPLTFSVVRASDSHEVINKQAIVDDTTFPTPAFTAIAVNGYVPEESQGKYYPLVIGYPGWQDPEVRSVVPIPMCQYLNTSPNSQVLVCDGAIDAAQVKLTNATDAQPTGTETRSVATATDNLGRTYSYVDFSAIASDTFGPSSDSYYAGFANTAGFGGGTKYRGRVLRGAADLLLWVTETFTDYRVDRGRVQAYESFFNAYKFDTFINEPVDAWEWFTNAILPWLPCTVATGPHGLWLAPYRWHATETDAVASLIEGENCTRKSGVRRRKGTIANVITVEYGPNRNSEDYYSRVTFTGEYRELPPYPFLAAIGIEPDNRIIADARCHMSQANWGVRAETVSVPTVWDSATAARIGRDLVAEKALPLYSATYTLDPGLAYLDPGDVVQLTDDDLAMTSVLAIVEDLAIDAGEVEAQLTVLDTFRQGWDSSSSTAILYE